MMHLNLVLFVYQGKRQNWRVLTSLFLSTDHSNLSWDCQGKDSASLMRRLTKFWTTSRECTSIVMILMTFIRSRMSKGLVTLLINLLILDLMSSLHSFIADSAPEDSYSKARLTSSVQTIWVVRRAIWAQ